MIMLLTCLFVLFVCCLSVNHKTEAATTVTMTTAEQTTVTTGLYGVNRKTFVFTARCNA